MANGQRSTWLVEAAGRLDVDGYLRRLGFDERPPRADLATLRALHRAQVERVAYENLDIQLGRRRSIEPLASAGHVLAGRGGYCYALNGAFSLLLTALGYRVTWHRAGVQGQPVPVPPGPAAANHLALTVTGLPDDDGAADDHDGAADDHDGAGPSHDGAGDHGGVWLVDAGLGDALHEPLPLRAGDHTQGPLTFHLRPSDVAPGGWRLDHDAKGSFRGMDFEPAPAVVDDFRERDEFLSTSPESGFVRTSVIQRRDATGVDQLRGLTLVRIGGLRRADAQGPDDADHPRETTVDTEAGWFEVLADVFDLPLPDVDADERHRLWARVHASHEAWIAANR